MPAIVQLCESNGAGETITHDISNMNMGDIDSPNLDPVAYSIIPGNNGYEKWVRLHLTDLVSSSAIRECKVYMTGSVGGGATMLCNATINPLDYTEEVYVQPTKNTSTKAIYTIPTTEPVSANIGFGGSLTGALTAPGYSDYIVFQIQTTPTDTAGATTQLNFAYVEVA